MPKIDQKCLLSSHEVFIRDNGYIESAKNFSFRNIRKYLKYQS